MRVIGVTGGIGTGKSTAVDIIRKAGYSVISTDEKAKEIMENDHFVKQRIQEEYGILAFNEDGTLSKDVLSNIVFGCTPEHRSALSKLNSIVHPPVIDWMIREVEQREDKEENMLFVECALIFEVCLDEGFDYIIVVDCPEELAVQRVMKRSGMTEEEVRARISTQLPQAEKVKLADFVIENKGTYEELQKSVNFILDILSKIP